MLIPQSFIQPGNASGIDHNCESRNDLSKFLQPMTALRSALGKSEFSSDTDCESNSVIAIYDSFKANPKFALSFPSKDVLVNLYIGWVKKYIMMLNHRKQFYDKDASSCLEALNGLFLLIPDLDPTNTAPFCDAVKEHEKELLRQCDLAGELLTAVRSDITAFGCKETAVLSIIQESWPLNLIID